MAYSHVNSKGQTYYLHANKIKRSSGKETTLYYFSREIKSDKALEVVPNGYTVVEMKTGLPALMKLSDARSGGTHGSGGGIDD